MTRLHAIGPASQPSTYHVQRLRTPASQTDAAKETSTTTIQIVAATSNGSSASGRNATARSGG